MEIFELNDDGLAINVGSEEQAFLTNVVGELRDLVMSESDPSLRRLNPPARPDDEDAEVGYRALVDNALLEGRLSAIETVEQGLQSSQVKPDHYGAWMQTINNLRLVIGEHLDITNARTPPLETEGDIERWSIYEYLGYVLQSLIEAIDDTLPDDPTVI